MTRADELIAHHRDASHRLAKIGKPQDHLKSSGHLSDVKVGTTVHYQASPGSTNYWQDEHFDKALAKVVRRRFTELAGQALALMTEEANAALLAEEEGLRARLAAIETLKARNPS